MLRFLSSNTYMQSRIKDVKSSFLKNSTKGAWQSGTEDVEVLDNQIQNFELKYPGGVITILRRRCKRNTQRASSIG